MLYALVVRSKQLGEQTQGSTTRVRLYTYKYIFYIYVSYVSDIRYQILAQRYPGTGTEYAQYNNI
jgi:hypothetical protein